MKDFFDLSPDPGAFVAPDGRFEVVNRAWAAELGWNHEDVADHVLRDLIHPEDSAAIDTLLGGLTAHPLTNRCGCRIRRGDGSWHPLDLSLHKLPDDGGVLISARPVTPDHARLRMALEALPDGFILYGADDRLLMCNSRFRELFHPVAHLLQPGASLCDVLHGLIETQVFPDAVGQEDAWFEHYRQPPPASGLDYEVRFHGDRWLRINERRTPDGGRVALCIDITHQVNSRIRTKTAEAAAHGARETLTSAIEALEDGFVLFDADDRLILCNRRYKDFHAPIREIIAPGVYFGDILRAGLDLQLFPEAIGREDEWYDQNIAPPPPEGHELEVGFADGRWVRIVERPTPEGGRVGLRIDITHQVESRRRAEIAEADARRARESLSSAIEALEDGFVLFDADDRLVLCNSRYREIYPAIASVIAPGVAFETLLRESVMAGEIAEAVGREEDWLRERLRQHRAMSGTFEQHLSDGRVLRIYETSTGDGGRVGLRIDVTELHQARARAEAASYAKSNFLSNMSHEIRTPLNAVLGMADLLAESSLDPDQEDMLMTIRDAGWSLLSLINDILDLARVEAGKLALEEEDFRPDALVERIVALHGANAVAKGITLSTSCSGACGSARRGDPSRIAQVLHNVIGNAVKFTEAGYVRLHVDAASPDELCFRIEDSGIGMNADQVDRMFDPFEQAEAGTTRRYGGTGLGMSIVKNLVDLMSGQIVVASAPSCGTTISITLAVPMSGTEAATAVHPEEQAASSGAGLDGLTVLVADDNAANRKILGAYLAKLGLDADFAQNGAEACERWEQKGYDLVLLDISMPVMGGVEALSEMGKYSRRHGHLPPKAFAVTANVMREQVDQYLHEGFVDVIHKPLRFTDLKSALERHTYQTERSAVLMSRAARSPLRHTGAGFE